MNTHNLTGKPRVLLIPDGFSLKFSGYATAVYAAEIMHKLDFSLAVYAQPDVEQVGFPYIQFFPLTIPFSTLNMLKRSREIEAEFKEVIESFKPTHIFIHGVGINKFPVYYDIAYQYNVKVVTMWLINDFYCIKNWAIREGKTCWDCVKGNSLPSFRHNCINDTRGDVSNFVRRREQVQGLWLRWLLRPRQLKVHKILGSCEDQLEMYRRFGHTDNQLLKCPFFYNPIRLKNLRSTVKRGDYFIFLGQHSETKGWDYIAQILDRCPNIKFLVPFMTIDNEPLERFDLQRHVASGHLTVITGTSWGTGTERYLAESLGVINPSVWATTTESVLMESLGLGKPVVVFSQGIHREVFRDGENGMMVELGDLDGFAERINRIKNMSETEYEMMSLKALELFDFLADDNRYMTALREAFL